MIGETLAHYRITQKIGAGGMGEVYRATDSKLHRDVAIKVISASYANDPERMARFEREAHVLASLSHGSIAAVYGLEDANGSKALVMELVEGIDLSDRLKQGPLPLTDALRTASQIAEALEAAHEHGIIHRDLKPANIKLLPDGRIKLLDFGLAKALEAASAEALADSATLSGGATRAGIVMGTAAYMSPEQATGAGVDKRTDVWAFGVVLFEMLTGQRLFAGETTSHTLAEVIRAEIDFTRLPATTPLGVARAARTVPRSRAASPAARHPRGAAGDRPPARAQRISALGSARGGCGAAAAGSGPRPGRGPDRRGRRGRRARRCGGGVAVVAAGPRRSSNSGSKCGCPPRSSTATWDPRSMSRPAGRASRLSAAARASASCGYGNSTSWTARSSRFATTTASPTIRSSRPMASGSVLSPPRRCAKCRRPAARR